VNYTDTRINEIPYFTPFSEVTFTSNLVSGIPTDFKFLKSFIISSSMCSTFKNVQLAAADPYISVRMPLKVEPTTLEFKIDDVTYSTVNVPGGCYYPHDLAATITNQLQPDLRLDFYYEARDYSLGPNQYLHVGDSANYVGSNAFYYVSCDNGTNVTTSTVTITCPDTDFLTNVLGLDTINIPCTVTPFENASVVGLQFSVKENGNFPMYTFKGRKPTRYYTDFGTLLDPVEVSTSFGNVTKSSNPRDYYNAAFYISLISDMEAHSSLSLTCLLDYDSEIYIPNTWKEIVYKLPFSDEKVHKCNELVKE
jgi:hypothetical protein